MNVGYVGLGMGRERSPCSTPRKGWVGRKRQKNSPRCLENSENAPEESALVLLSLRRPFSIYAETGSIESQRHVLGICVRFGLDNIIRTPRVSTSVLTDRKRKFNEVRRLGKRKSAGKLRNEKRRSYLKTLPKAQLVSMIVEAQAAKEKEVERQGVGLGVIFNEMPDHIHASQFGFSILAKFSEFQDLIQPYVRHPQERVTNKYNFELAFRATMFMLRKGEPNSSIYYYLPTARSPTGHYGAHSGV